MSFGIRSKLVFIFFLILTFWKTNKIDDCMYCISTLKVSFERNSIRIRIVSSVPLQKEENFLVPSQNKNRQTTISMLRFCATLVSGRHKLTFYKLRTYLLLSKTFRFTLNVTKLIIIIIPIDIRLTAGRNTSFSLGP